MARRRKVPACAAVLLCCVLLAMSPPVALADECRDECVAAGCNSWPLLCQISCTSACMGQIGILSLDAAAPKHSPDSQKPGELSVLRGLKPDNEDAQAPNRN